MTFSAHRNSQLETFVFSRIVVFASLCAIALSACSPNAQVPTLTPVPPTAMVSQTLTPTAEDAPAANVPTEVPTKPRPPTGRPTASVPTASRTPVPSKTPRPTDTPLPAEPSSTPTQLPPTAIPKAPSSVDQSQTMGTPVPSWNGLPVMPDAIECKPAGFSYVYAVKIPISEAEAYYQKQMSADGWMLADRQSNEKGLFGGPAVVLNFTRNGKRANVLLVFSTNENYTMVSLTTEQ